MTKERFEKAKKLKLVITAGIGSDHTDLQAAMDKGVTVAEVTCCNSLSVSEHIVMMILALVRNYIPSYGWVVKGGRNIADCVERSYDLEGMNVGTVAAGRIGLAALRRLKPFDVKLHYYDKYRLPESVEKELGLTFHPNVESLVKVCDVVTINTPLHPETEHLFDDKLISKMKRGSYIVNTARGKIVDRDAIVRALESGQLAGYAGDVWFPQPAPQDHPWRTMAAYVRSGQPGDVCVETEYASRADGLAGLQRAYGFELPRDRRETLEQGLIFQSTADGVCLFGEVAATDGRIPALGLKVLTDDRGYHITYSAVPVFRADVFDRAPQVADLFAPITAALDQQTMQQLNGRVSAGGQSPRDVARAWLAERGFIGS